MKKRLEGTARITRHTSEKHEDMLDRDHAAVRTIKSKIADMLEERKRLAEKKQSVHWPSKYWTDFCSNFDYLRSLPEESFLKLRLHTYPLTGDNFLTYYLEDPKDLEKRVRKLTKDIPPGLVLNEPPGGIGYSFGNGRFVSRDVLKYQNIVIALFRHKILAFLEAAGRKSRIFVLEIGGGYGGLAYHLSNILGNATYFIVDLPETLIFSAAYLSLNNPGKNLYLYDHRSFSELIRSPSISSYDFVLVPNYRLNDLRHLKFLLAMNTDSFQEMRTEQVEAYLEFIQETCAGVFYSWNKNTSPANSEISDLREILKRALNPEGVVHPRMTFTERLRHTASGIRLILRTVGVRTGLLKRTRRASLPYQEFIWQKGASATGVNRENQALR